jgi:hypothetical protein
MKTLAIALLAGAAALAAGSAKASDVYMSGEYANPDLVQQVRLVCDDAGRCYRTRGGRRVVIQEYGDSYNYAPRERYIERRGYYDSGYYNSGPSVGIGVGAGGVGVNVGVGPRW